MSLLGVIITELMTEKKKYIGYLAHEMYNQSISGYIRECDILLKSMQCEYEYPASDIPPKHPAIIAYNNLYKYILYNSSQDLSNGIIIINNNFIAEEFSWGWGKTRTRSKPDRFKKTVTIDEPVYIFSGLGYHAVVEDLMHVSFLYDKLKEAKIIIAKENYYAQKLLSTLFPKLKMVLLPRNVLVKSQNIIATTKSPLGEFVHPELPRAFNKKLYDYNNINHDIQKIYISRAKSIKRYWPMEYKFEELLKEIGFTVCRLEELLISEQIQIFQNAKLILGRHGAGLTNICFCKHNIKVVEIYESNHYNACYSNLAASLGFKYYAVKHDRKNDTLIKLLDKVSSHM